MFAIWEIKRVATIARGFCGSIHVFLSSIRLFIIPALTGQLSEFAVHIRMFSESTANVQCKTLCNYMCLCLHRISLWTQSVIFLTVILSRLCLCLMSSCHLSISATLRELNWIGWLIDWLTDCDCGIYSVTLDWHQHDGRHKFMYSYAISCHHWHDHSAASSSRLLWSGLCRIQLSTTSSASVVIVRRFHACPPAPETTCALRACADRRAGAAISTTALPVGARTRTISDQHRTNADPGNVQGSRRYWFTSQHAT